jgi:hypothetical protein
MLLISECQREIYVCFYFNILQCTKMRKAATQWRTNGRRNGADERLLLVAQERADLPLAMALIRHI